jgi:sugar lactone lactonase YvrE
LFGMFFALISYIKQLFFATSCSLRVKMKHQCSHNRFLILLVSALLVLSPFPVMAGMGMGGGFGLPSTPEPNEVEQVITPGPMKSPMRITMRGVGKFLVSDYQGKRIYEVDAEQPEEPDEVLQLTGHPLAIESAGRYIFIGDDKKGTIELHRERNVRRKKSVGRIIARDVQPSDFAYDSRKRWLFVADSRNREIKIYRRSGRYVDSFGSSAPLSDPKGVAVDRRRQKVYVTDYGDPVVGISASVNVFDYKGRLLKRFTGNFGRPQGIAIDDNNIYFVDAVLGQILVYDRTTYESNGTIGTFGAAEGSLLLPMDLVLDKNAGKLYVTNNRMGRVASFAIPGL